MTQPAPLPASQAAPPLPPKKEYTREFKRETWRLLQSSGRPKADLERDLGLYPGQIRLWQRALGRNAAQMDHAFPGAGHQRDLDAQRRALRREKEILRQERDILKKAGAIFSTTHDPR
jgi:transposase